MAIALMLLGILLFLNGVGISIAAVLVPTVSDATVITAVTLLTLLTYVFAGVPRARYAVVRSWIVLTAAIAARAQRRARRSDPNRL